jgi:hypothetical protein
VFQLDNEGSYDEAIRNVDTVNGDVSRSARNRSQSMPYHRRRASARSTQPIAISATGAIHRNCLLCGD